MKPIEFQVVDDQHRPTHQKKPDRWGTVMEAMRNGNTLFFGGMTAKGAVNIRTVALNRGMRLSVKIGSERGVEGYFAWMVGPR